MKQAIKYLILAFLILLSIGGCSDDNSCYYFPNNTAVTESIQITPAQVSVPKGTTGVYTAVAYKSDGSYEDVSDKVVWNSSDPSVVQFSITTSNYAEAVDVGTVTITAELDGVMSNNASVEVTNATLDYIELDPILKSVAAGVEVKYRAIGFFSNGTHYNLTLFSSFTSSNSAVASIESLGLNSGLASTLTTGTTTIRASFKGTPSNSAVLNVTAALITGLQVTPADVVVPKGTTGVYTALAIYSDGSTADVSSLSIWSSADTNIVTGIASGEDAGYAEAVNPGITTIAASFSGISTTAKVEVTPADLQSIVINPIIKKVASGVDVPYEAIGIYSDNSSHDLSLFVTWQSSNLDVATIEGIGAKAGLASTLNAGETEITATYDGVLSNSATLTVSSASLVSIQVTPADVSVAVGTQDRFTAIGFYTDSSSHDISSQATWVSDAPAVVNVVSSGNDGGLMTALSIGTANITASMDGVNSNNVYVNVTGKTVNNVQITPHNFSFPLGTYMQYEVSVIYDDLSVQDVTDEVQIISLSPDKAVFDTNNIAQGIGIGDVEITTSYEGVTSEQEFLHITAATVTSIQITPAFESVAKGTLLRYTAVAYYSDNTHKNITNSATWISNDTNTVAIIPSGILGGEAYALNTGIALIIASYDGQISNQATLLVSPATLSSVEIVATDIEFPKGTSAYYRAVAHYSDFSTIDITTDAIWISLNPNIAVVHKGKVTGVNVGPATVRIDYQGKNDTQALAITNPSITGLIITPDLHDMAIGLSQSYLATAEFSDGSTKNVTKDVTWISSNLAVAKISPDGTATGITEGSSDINAAYQGSIVGNTAVLNILASAISLDTIDVTPVNLTVTIESTTGYTAIGNYSNGDTKDITQDVTWSSSSVDIATIDTTGDLKGVATAVSSGTTTISANLDGVKGSTSLIVSGDCGNKQPDSILITPNPASVVIGYSVQFHLKGIWSSGCEREITYDPAAVWKSDDDNIVSMRSKGGEAFGHEVGSTNINVTYRSSTDTAVINVTP